MPADAARRAAGFRAGVRCRDGAGAAKKSATGAASTSWPAYITGDAVADLVGGAEIVGGEQHRDAALARQLLQQLQDLRLDGDVERRGRLVGDDQLGLRQQRHGDHQPLALATGDLMRILGAAAAPDRASARRAASRASLARSGARAGVARAEPPCRAAPGCAQRRLPAASGRSICVPIVNSGLKEPYGSCGMKVMRRPRTSSRDAPGAMAEQVLAAEADAARLDARGVARQDAEDGAGQRGLAATGLADQPHDLARAGSTGRRRRARARRPPRWRRRRADRSTASRLIVWRPPRRMRGSSTSRKPSPSRLKPITTRKMARPGAAAYHQASGRNSRISAMVRPHSGVGGGAPSPRKPSAPAVRMVKPMPIVVRTMIDDDDVRQDVQQHHAPGRARPARSRPR